MLWFCVKRLGQIVCVRPYNKPEQKKKGSWIEALTKIASRACTWVFVVCGWVCVCACRVGGANRRESAISWTWLSPSCGQSSDERSGDTAGLNKHAAAHVFDPGLTWGISHWPFNGGFIFMTKKKKKGVRATQVINHSWGFELSSTHQQCFG